MRLLELVYRMNYILRQGTLDREISGVVYDSRKAVPGCVFVALPGAVADGHDFIPEAVALGAAAVVAERAVPLPPGVTLLEVTDGREALAELAAAWFGHPAERLVTVGITGTKGKTTTTTMLRAILEESGRPAGLIGTVGVELGEERLPAVNTTPESWLLQSYFARLVEKGIRYAVLEVSSQALKLRRTAGFTLDYGVFTNLAPEHISPGEHADFAEYLACKRLLFRQCRAGIVNVDAEHLGEVLEGHTCTLETFGIDLPADLRAEDIAPDTVDGRRGVRFRLAGAERYPVRVGMPGRFTVYNALGAIAASRQLGASPEAVQRALRHVQVRGRLEQVPVPGGYTLLIDYAHNALSLSALLTTLRVETAGRLICLFGCGGNRARDRRFEMGEVSGRLADFTIVTSDNPRREKPEDILADIITGVRRTGGAYTVVPDRRDAIRFALHMARPGDTVVLAGKGHETYQERDGVRYPMDEREIVRKVLEEEKP